MVLRQRVVNNFRYQITLNITREEWLKLYRGAANTIICRAEDGTRIKIAAVHFIPFVTHSGVAGRFELVIDNDHKLVSLKRM
jgi:hypothetical protein